MEIETPAGLSEQEPQACPMPSATHLPEDEDLITLLAQARSVAVVGASPSDHRTSYAIATWLMARTPYEIYLVNPVAQGQEIRGHGFYDSLDQLPVTPDIVDVFRRSEHVPAVAQEAIDAGAGALWLQLGVVNEDAAHCARAAGLSVVQNHCLKVEYERLRSRIEEAAAP